MAKRQILETWVDGVKYYFYTDTIRSRSTVSVDSGEDYTHFFKYVKDGKFLNYLLHKSVPDILFTIPYSWKDMSLTSHDWKQMIRKEVKYLEARKHRMNQIINGELT